MDPEHGPMVVLQSGNQYCPNQWHDGRPGKEGHPPSRNRWPLQFFDRAVAEYRATLKPVELPPLDIDL